MDSILDELPAEMGETTDWNVKLVDGTLLPCHSQCLGAVSPVLAFALKTANKDASIPFPKRLSQDAAHAFFRWVYRLNFAFTPSLAYELALLSHEWDVKGLAEDCDKWLMRNSMTILDKRSLRDQGAPSKTSGKRQRSAPREAKPCMADWLSLSDECQLPCFRSRCVKAAIVDWEFHRKDFQQLDLKGSLWSLMIDKAIAEGKMLTQHWKQYALSLEEGSGDEDSASLEMSPENSDDELDDDD